LCGAALVAAITGALPAGRAVGNEAGAETLQFAVMRNGDKIGHHRIAFAPGPDSLRVEIDVEIRVRLLMVTVYRFVHRATEVWRDGRLWSLQSVTDDDGAPHELGVIATGNGLIIKGDGRERIGRADLIPTSLWNAAVRRSKRLLNSLDGSEMPVRVGPLGRETLSVQGHPLSADGFLIDGGPEFTRWVWFDGRGRLVAVRLHGRDGSLVDYKLQ
jgi:hypothetical protein